MCGCMFVPYTFLHGAFTFFPLDENRENEKINKFVCGVKIGGSQKQVLLLILCCWSFTLIHTQTHMGGPYVANTIVVNEERRASNLPCL